LADPIGVAGNDLGEYGRMLLALSGGPNCSRIAAMTAVPLFAT
jgi:hypothetical protein